MSEFSAKTIRAARKAKATKMGSADPHTKVDSSDWTPADPLNADIKTGARPLSRRAFKKGGKVVGEKAKANMGRKPRCGGGNAGKSWVNRNVKEANEEREGKKHVGAFKKGGRTKKEFGGAASDVLSLLSPAFMVAKMIKGGGDKDDKKSGLAQAAPSMAENKKRGGRTRKANGGEETAKKIPMPPRRSDYFPEENQPIKQDKSKQLPGDYPTNASGYADQNRKRGGRTKKMDGGQMMAPGAAPMPAPMGDPRLGAVRPTRFNFGAGPQGTPYKKGGKVHSDEAMDKALIKKMVKSSARTGKSDGGVKKIPEGRSGLSPAEAEKWKERSSLPAWASGPAGGQETFAERKAKYVPQSEITEPLSGDLTFKRGGKARTKRATGGGVFSGPSYPGKIPGVVGGRVAKAVGGAKRGKGKTNINIVINAGKKPEEAGPGMPPGMPPGGPMSLQRPAPSPGGAMPPGAMPPMPPGGPGAPPPGMPPLARKSGGRITKVARSYKDMQAGAGSGEGRLQKTDIAKLHKDAPARKSGGKVYKSYKDMDAGAGSGEGRLEKTEIQKRKR